MNLQICLVSDQLLANYIPVMMFTPDQVHLVSSKYVESKGLTARFVRMLEQQAIKVVLHGDMPDTDMQAIREYAQNLIHRIDQSVPNANITLNLTGGNKLMMLGMWEVFNGGVELIYTDTLNSCIEHLHNQRTTPLRSVLDIRRYLQAYGVRYVNAFSDEVSWQQQVLDRKSVTRYLADNAEKLGDFFGVINWLVYSSLEIRNREYFLRTQGTLLRSRPKGLWRTTMLMLQNAGFITWDGGLEVTFNDVESARYLGGIWLEEYAYLTAREAAVEHVACSVRINWEKSRQTTNELDLILVHENRMLVIECKTLRLGADERKDSDMIYKISDLGDELRGLFGETWLVSARKPDPVLTARAKSRRLHILAGGELKSLKKNLIHWMNN